MYTFTLAKPGSYPPNQVIKLGILNSETTCNDTPPDRMQWDAGTHAVPTARKVSHESPQVFRSNWQLLEE